MKKVSALQQKIIEHIKENPDATHKEIGLATGIKSKAVTSYHIKELILKGHLKKINKWIVK